MSDRSKSYLTQHQREILARRAEPGSDLTMDQRRAAKALAASRPMVVPGTRAIIVEAEAKVWHDSVTAKMVELKLKPQQVIAFCDLCGVSE